MPNKRSEFFDQRGARPILIGTHVSPKGRDAKDIVSHTRSIQGVKRQQKRTLRVNAQVLFGILLILMAGGIALFYIPLRIKQMQEPGQTLVPIERWVIVDKPRIVLPPKSLVKNLTATIAPAARFVKLGSADANQFYSYQWKNFPDDNKFNPDTVSWVRSECSAHAMAEIFLSYGKSIKIGDILNEEFRLKLWTPWDGTLNKDAIVNTADHFGFKTLYHNWMPVNRDSFKLIDHWLNEGHPLIVAASGHWIFMYKHQNGVFYFFDSSINDVTTLSDDEFLNYWIGYVYLIVPKK